jgi:tetratricopeptide (TPR) repeat protein
MNKQALLAALAGVMLTGTLVTTLPAHAANKVYQMKTTYVKSFGSADALFQTGKFEQAEKRFGGMLKANPKNANARGGLALAQAELFKLDPAEKNALEVLRKSPNNALAHMALGVVYRNRTASHDMTYKSRRADYLAASERELQRAVELAPNSAEAWTQLANTQRFAGRSSEAHQSYMKALEVDSNYGEALLGDGLMKMEQGDLSGGKISFQQAIKRNSGNYMAHYRMGEALLKEGDNHGALKYFNNALALNKDNAAIETRMGDAYEKQGNQSAAIAYYRRASQHNPGFMPAYLGLSNIWDGRGDGELAMAELKSALNINPNYGPARNQLGKLALMVDKPEQSVQYYQESLKANSQDAEALNGLSQALTVVAQKTAMNAQTMGSDSTIVNAEQAIEQALQLNPNDLRLHLAHMRISQLAGKPAATDAELERLVANPPRNEAEEMIQGEAFLSLGRYDEADKVFNSLMEKAHRDPDKLLVIGDTLKANGDLLRAKDAYQAVLNVESNNLKATRGIQRIERAQTEADKTARMAGALNTWRKKQQVVSIDFYKDALSKNPRQPEQRLILSKLLEKNKRYNDAAISYQHYLGLMPNLPEKDKEYFQKKISRLQELHSRQMARAQQQTQATNR